MPTLGRKVMPDDLIAFALTKVTDEDLKKLKVNSLRQTDIDKLLYQAFLKKKLGYNKEAFSSFTRSPDYYSFVQENQTQFTM